MAETAPNHKLNYVLAAIIGIAALLVGVFAQEWLNRQQPPELKNATLYPEDFRPLPAFELQTHRGTPLNNASLQGQWSLFFFGFTHCPDVCPNTLAVLQEAYGNLGDKNENLNVIFVSVDPERDNLTDLGDYVEYFNPTFTGATAPLDQLQVLTKGINVHFRTIANEDNPQDYMVDHSAALFVINPEGRQHALISPPLLPGVLANDLKAMMEAW